MAGEFIEFFNELMFGSGNWIGLIIIAVILLIMAGLHRWGGIIAMPIGILVGLEYASHNLGWHAILLIFEGILVMFLSIQKVKGK